MSRALGIPKVLNLLLQGPLYILIYSILSPFEHLYFYIGWNTRLPILLLCWCGKLSSYSHSHSSKKLFLNCRHEKHHPFVALIETIEQTMAVKYRSPLGPGSLEGGSYKPLSILPSPSSCSPEHALQKLLENPIRFVLATSLTFEDEASMAPILRPRKHLNESPAQQANRMNVSGPAVSFPARYWQHN